jgi:hypothetical protein
VVGRGLEGDEHVHFRQKRFELPGHSPLVEQRLFALQGGAELDFQAETGGDRYSFF